MNNVFNAKRFGMLFIKHTTEHYKTYLMSLGVLIGVMLLGGSFLVYLIPGGMEKQEQMILYVAVLFLAGTIFASTVFADYGDNKKAITSLTLPATNFEKFLVAWLFSYFIFYLVFTASFYGILALLLSTRQAANGPNEIFNVFAEPALFLFIAFSLLHSIALWGAIAFKKLHFIKTAFCFFISVAVLTLINTLFLEALIGRDIRPATPFSNIVFEQQNKFFIVGSIREGNMQVNYLLILVSLIFWVAAYYKLKEKQV